MIFGFLKIEEDKQLRHLKSPVRCRNCYFWIEEESGTCEYCGIFRSYAQPKNWLEKIKRYFGIEISSDLVVLSIKESDKFFTDDELETVLDNKKFKVLGLEDVPDWTLMFINSKRVNKPIARRAPLKRQIANNRPNPKLLVGNQDYSAIVSKRILSPTSMKAMQNQI